MEVVILPLLISPLLQKKILPPEKPNEMLEAEKFRAVRRCWSELTSSALAVLFCSAQQEPELLWSLLFLSSLWPDLSIWGHFLRELNLRNLNLRAAHIDFSRQCILRHIKTILSISAPCGQIWAVLLSLSSLILSWFVVMLALVIRGYNLQNRKLFYILCYENIIL